MKWTINVRYDGNDENATKKFEIFRDRMLRSGVPGIKGTDFDVKHLTFTHICNEPKEVFDFFYLLNPVNGSDDIYEGSQVSIIRGGKAREGRYPWGKSDKSQKKQGI